MNRILNGRYRIDGVVGDGGMAVVYRGWDTVLNRVVAIKVLREQYAQNDQFLARFRREAQSAAGLAHPNIVNVYDVGRDGDTWYIVQELIDGTDLATLIRQRGQFTVADATEVIAQVASGLDYAHSRGLIHRDVKPHNILIDSRGTAKVVDFGIAKGVNDIRMTDAGTALGTAGYISPEQATGSPLTPASDLYSVGVVLYEMLTGRLPFVGDTAVSVAMQHVRNAPPPPTRFNARIPRPIEAVILRTLEKLSERRYTSGADLVAALRGSPVPGPAAPVAVASGAGDATRALPENPRALPVETPRGRVPTAPPGRNGTRRVDPLPTPPPRRTTGPGIGTWLLGILLLGGLLTLVFLGYKLANASNAPPPPANATLTPVSANESATTAATPKASASITTTPSGTASPTQDPNAVLVPNLSGSYQPQAADALTKIGLGLGKETQQTSETVLRGQIIAQDPRAGDFVKRGSQINIVTSLGPTIVDLSGLNVKGKAFEDVNKQLTDLGLKPNRQDEPSEDVATGLVTRIQPSDKIVHDGTVAVFVSTGKPTPTPSPATPTPSATVKPTAQATPAAGNGVVPDVIGQPAAMAQRQMAQAGFGNVPVYGLTTLPPGAQKRGKGTIAAVYDTQSGKVIPPGQALPKDTPLALLQQTTD